MPVITSQNVTRKALTPGEPVLDQRHSHAMARITGYVVVSTSFIPGCDIVLTDTELVDGATNYGKALDLMHDLRRKYAGEQYAYAVVAHLYECGCRSDGEIKF